MTTLNDDALAYVNGEFTPLAEARVPVLDRGFLFGDGVYEVVPAYAGRLFRLHEHLARLQQSLDGVRIANPYSHQRWEEVLGELVSRCGASDQSVYLQVTRGAAATRKHTFPADAEPTVFAMSTPLATIGKAVRERGARVVTQADTRWQYCHLKTISLLPNVLLQQLAVDAEADESILVRDGMVTEGSSSNVFVVHGGVVTTPPKGQYLLPGITRDLVLELLEQEAIPWREQQVSPRELVSAEEVWITSSTREVLPVVSVDGLAVGDGRPGPVWQQAIAAFDRFKESLRAGDNQ